MVQDRTDLIEECVELYLHSLTLLMAWCLVKHKIHFHGMVL